MTRRHKKERTELSEEEDERQRVDLTDRGTRQVAGTSIATRPEEQPAVQDHQRTSTPDARRYPGGARNQRGKEPKGEIQMHYHWGPGPREAQLGRRNDYRTPGSEFTKRPGARRAHDPPPQPHFADGAYPGRFLEKFEDWAAGAHIPVASLTLVIQKSLPGRQQRWWDAVYSQGQHIG